MSEVKSETKFINEEIGAPSRLGDKLSGGQEGTSGSKTHVDLFRGNIDGGVGFGASATGEFLAGLRHSDLNDDQTSISAFFKNGEGGLLAESEHLTAGYHHDRLGLGYGVEDFGAAVILNTESLADDRIDIPSVSVRIKDVRFEFTEAGASIDGDVNQLLNKASDAIPFSITEQMRQSKFFGPLMSVTDDIKTDISIQNSRLSTSAMYTLEDRSIKVGYQLDMRDSAKEHRLTIHGSLPAGQVLLDVPLQGDDLVLTLTPAKVPQLHIKLSEKEASAAYEIKR